MPTTHHTISFKEYEGRWVALSEDGQTVLGAGSTARAALDAAQAQGHTDVTLKYVQPLDMLYCGVGDNHWR